ERGNATRQRLNSSARRPFALLSSPPPRVSASRLHLVTLQGDDWIDSGCTYGRYEACQQRDPKQNRYDTAKRQRVCWTDREQNARHEARQQERTRQSNSKSDNHQLQSRAQDQLRDAYRLCPKCNSYPDLAGSLRNHVRRNAIYSDGRQNQSQQSEPSEYRCRYSRWKQR